MSRDTLPAVVHGAADAKVVILWLHGLGADGHDFEPIVPELGLDPTRVRFVFPHAPVRPVTINGGMAMRAWYDIREEDLLRQADREGLEESSDRIADLMAREGENGVPVSHIILAGFSQGGAVALHRALVHPEPVAGVIALSTYLPTDTPAPGYDPARVPVFQGHGSFDPIVPVTRGAAARDRLQELGYPVTYRAYPMPHAVCAEEIADLGSWLAQVPGIGEGQSEP